MENDLTGILMSVFMIGLLIGLGIWEISAFTTSFNKKEITSKNIIEPEVRLVIDNNQIDTLYVYKEQ